MNKTNFSNPRKCLNHQLIGKLPTDGPTQTPFSPETQQLEQHDAPARGDQQKSEQVPEQNHASSQQGRVEAKGGREDAEGTARIEATEQLASFYERGECVLKLIKVKIEKHFKQLNLVAFINNFHETIKY